MKMLENFNVFKAVGIFATVTMLIVFFGSTIVHLIDAIKRGDSKDMLIFSGGSLLSLDITLNEQTDSLLEETSKTAEERDVKKISLDFAYALSTLFVYFLIFYFLFLLLNWIGGIRALSMGYDLLIILFILGSFFFLEYLYSSIILNEFVLPLSGIWRFVTNTPDIIRNLF